MAQNSRLPWVDCAKGIGITLVVYSHVQRGVLATGIADANASFAWIDYALYLSHMPLFFVLSGLFVGRSLEKGQKHFLLTKLQTLVYPYVLWSFIQGAIQIGMAGSTNHTVQWADLYSIAWKPFQQFWFLYALFLTQIAALLLYRHKRLLVAASLLAYACHGVAPGILGDACFHFPFLVLGMLLADRGALDGSPAVERGRVWVPALLAAGFVVFAAGSGLLNGRDPVGFTALPASLLAIALLLWIASALRGPAAAAFQLLGQASMTIYVLHTISGSAMRIVLVKLGATSVLLHLVAGMAAGLLVPFLAHHVLERLNLLPWFGLATFRRGPARSAARSVVGWPLRRLP